MSESAVLVAALTDGTVARLADCESLARFTAGGGSHASTGPVGEWAWASWCRTAADAVLVARLVVAAGASCEVAAGGNLAPFVVLSDARPP